MLLYVGMFNNIWSFVFKNVPDREDSQNVDHWCTEGGGRRDSPSPPTLFGHSVKNFTKIALLLVLSYIWLVVWSIIDPPSHIWRVLLKAPWRIICWSLEGLSDQHLSLTDPFFASWMIICWSLEGLFDQHLMLADPFLEGLFLVLAVSWRIVSRCRLSLEGLFLEPAVSWRIVSGAAWLLKDCPHHQAVKGGVRRGGEAVKADG